MTGVTQFPRLLRPSHRGRRRNFLQKTTIVRSSPTQNLIRNYQHGSKARPLHQKASAAPPDPTRLYSRPARSLTHPIKVLHPLPSLPRNFPERCLTTILLTVEVGLNPPQTVRLHLVAGRTLPSRTAKLQLRRRKTLSVASSGRDSSLRSSLHSSGTRLMSRSLSASATSIGRTNREVSLLPGLHGRGLTWLWTIEHFIRMMAVCLMYGRSCGSADRGVERMKCKGEVEGGGRQSFRLSRLMQCFRSSSRYPIARIVPLIGKALYAMEAD